MQLPLPGASRVQDLPQQLLLLKQLLLVFEAQAELRKQRLQSPQHGGRSDCDQQASQAKQPAYELPRRGGHRVDVFLRHAIDDQQGLASHGPPAVLAQLAVRVLLQVRMRAIRSKADALKQARAKPAHAQRVASIGVLHQHLPIAAGNQTGAVFEAARRGKHQTGIQVDMAGHQACEFARCGVHASADMPLQSAVLRALVDVAQVHLRGVVGAVPG